MRIRPKHAININNNKRCDDEETKSGGEDIDEKIPFCIFDKLIDRQRELSSTSSSATNSRLAHRGIVAMCITIDEWRKHSLSRRDMFARLQFETLYQSRKQ